jgi:DNA-binding response OmpR family regulator
LARPSTDPLPVLARGLRGVARPSLIDGVMSPKHVLVVDDDPMVLEIVERALSAANFRVSKARRVAIAKDVLIRQTIDLIISDARISGETGLHLAATVQQLGIAFILMSGDPEWAAEHGIASDQYLAKPFELRHLVKLVHSSLDEVCRSTKRNPSEAPK